MAANSEGVMTGAMVDELRKADGDQANHRRTGRRDLWHGPVRLLEDPLPGEAGEHFTGGRRLVHMVKAQLQKAVEDDVHIVQVLKLPIEGGVGDGDGIGSS